MTAQLIVAIIVGLLGSGGLAAAVVALIKLRPEAGQILVTTAQGVVIVQSSVIDNLTKELARVSEAAARDVARVRKEMDELREECRERERELHERIKELEHQNDTRAS